ncbi:MAG TPA: hypothetical protein VKZ53_02115 [Candidatus Angelobacter sp.]|nr:hypothetical protein [Candidatus Angelobacter sp.]
MARPPQNDRHDTSTTTTISRRSFGYLALGAAASVTLVQPSRALSHSSAFGEQPPPNQPALSPASVAEVEMKFNDVMRKYGSRLSDEQKADVRKVLTDTQSGLEKMREFLLQNGDQPAAVFRVYSGKETK